MQNIANTTSKPAKPTPRHRSREFTLQGLYQWYLAGQDEAAVIASVRELEAFHKADAHFCLKLISGVISNKEKLIEHLTPHLDRSFSSLSAIEASILLMGTYELLEEVATPYRVIINEYVELTKTFGGTDSYKYINGVLDNIAIVLRAEERKQQK